MSKVETDVLLADQWRHFRNSNTRVDDTVITTLVTRIYGVSSQRVEEALAKQTAFAQP